MKPRTPSRRSRLAGVDAGELIILRLQLRQALAQAKEATVVARAAQERASQCADRLNQFVDSIEVIGKRP